MGGGGEARSDTETSIVASSLFKRLPVFSSGDCKHPCQGERLLMAAAVTQVDVQETQAQAANDGDKGAGGLDGPE